MIKRVGRCLALLLFAFCYMQNKAAYGQTCNSATEYTCTNSNCIPLAKVNDTLNDCGDNSEEGFPWSCPGKFKCTNALPNGFGQCQDINFVADGYKECNDGSDEIRVIGSGCIQSADCCPCDTFVNNSFCNSTNKCDCISGWYENTNKTICTIRVMFDPCSTDPDCYDAITNTACLSGRCECKYGYRENADNTSCLLNMIYDPCQISVDCNTYMPNSDCVGEVCLCNSGYHPDSANSSCNKNKIGDSCTLPSDCTNVISHSQCSTATPKVCECLTNYRPKSDLTRCLTYKIQDSCTNSTQCVFGVSFSSCTGGACECDSGYLADSVTLATCSLRVIGTVCSVDTDCSDAVTDSYCASGICTCISGYAASSDLLNCSRRSLGDTCTTVEDCTGVIPNSNCSSGICDCNIGSYVTGSNNDTCTARILGDSCAYAEQCSVAFNNSICSNGTCSCDVAYYDTGNVSTCDLRTVNTPCVSDTNCSLQIPFSSCQNSLCACLTGYIASPNGTVCSERGVGDPCTSSTDCVSISGGSQCGATSGVCECLTGYLSLNQLNCTVRVEGDACNVHSDCSLIPELAKCISGICQCASPGDCTAPTLGSLACSTSSYCLNWFSNSDCVNGFCVCVSGYTESTGSCVQSGASQSCDFACQHWWAILLILLLVFAAAALIIALLYFKAKNKKSKSFEIYSNGQSGKQAPSWKFSVRQAHRFFHVMYKDKNMDAPEEIDVLGDYSHAGGAPAILSVPPTNTNNKMLSRPNSSVRRPMSGFSIRSNGAMRSGLVTPSDVGATRKSSSTDSDGFKNVQLVAGKGGNGKAAVKVANGKTPSQNPQKETRNQTGESKSAPNHDVSGKSNGYGGGELTGEPYEYTPLEKFTDEAEEYKPSGHTPLEIFSEVEFEPENKPKKHVRLKLDDNYYTDDFEEDDEKDYGSLNGQEPLPAVETTAGTSHSLVTKDETKPKSANKKAKTEKSSKKKKNKNNKKKKSKQVTESLQ